MTEFKAVAVDGDRVYEMSYFDNTAIIERFNPYGFFKIRLKHGETPTSFKDQLFTAIEYAELAVREELQKKLIPAKTKV